MDFEERIFELAKRVRLHRDKLDKLAEEERARLAEPVGDPDTLPSPPSKRTSSLHPLGDG